MAHRPHRHRLALASLCCGRRACPLRCCTEPSFVLCCCWPAATPPSHGLCPCSLMAALSAAPFLNLHAEVLCKRRFGEPHVWFLAKVGRPGCRCFLLLSFHLPTRHMHPTRPHTLGCRLSLLPAAHLAAATVVIRTQRSDVHGNAQQAVPLSGTHWGGLVPPHS